MELSCLIHHHAFGPKVKRKNLPLSPSPLVISWQSHKQDDYQFSPFWRKYAITVGLTPQTTVAPPQYQPTMRRTKQPCHYSQCQRGDACFLQQQKIPTIVLVVQTCFIDASKARNLLQASLSATCRRGILWVKQQV